MICPHCHSALDDAPDLAGQVCACPRCGGQFQIPGSPPTVVSASAFRRKPKRGGLGPAMFSFFIPGLGQLFDGRAERGLMIIVSWIIAMCTGFFFFFPFIAALLIWIWSVVDAAQG
jgi:TM2 domain-containing membrane protein YozV